MMIFAEPDEEAERLEELFSLAQRNDEVIIRREGEPIAALRIFSGRFRSEQRQALAADGGAKTGR
jgi:hypothetical protein